MEDKEAYGAKSSKNKSNPVEIYRTTCLLRNSWERQLPGHASLLVVVEINSVILTNLPKPQIIPLL